MPEKRRRTRKAILFVAFVIAAAVLGTLLVQKYRARHEFPSAPAAPQEAGTFVVTLFFASPDGSGLVREAREMEACGELDACLAPLVEELVNGPLGDLTPTLPQNAAVRSVQVNGDLALVDFGPELVAGLTGGSHAEMMAVYSVIDTISYNFPRIKRVKFLVEGKDQETLKGHLDLREPLEPDFSLEKK